MKDIGKFVRKLESAYSDKGVVTYIDYAQKGETYYFDDKLTIPLLVADGKINVKHFRRHPKVDIELIRDVIGSSESPEHFNAKRKILNEKSVNINGTIIKGHSAEEEVRFSETNNIVDVVLYDSKGEVLLGIEVCYKNKKSKEIINKLNKLNINIYEKNITNIEQSRFLCLCRERYDRNNNNNRRGEFVSKKTDIDRLEKEIRELEEESRGDSERIKKGGEFLHMQQTDINRLERGIKSEKMGIAKGNEQIDEIEAFGVEGSQRRVEEDIEFTEGEIKELKDRIRELEGINSSEKELNRLIGDRRKKNGKIESEVREFESKVENLESKIEATERRIRNEETDIQEQEGGIGRVEERIRGIRNENK